MEREQIVETGMASTELLQYLAKRQADVEMTAVHLRDRAGVKKKEPVPDADRTLIAEITKATPIGLLDDKTKSNLDMSTLPEGYEPEKLATVSLIWDVDDPDAPPEKGRLAAIEAEVHVGLLDVSLESFTVPMLPTEPMEIGQMSEADFAQLLNQVTYEHMNGLDALERLLDPMHAEEDRLQQDDRSLFA